MSDPAFPWKAARVLALRDLTPDVREFTLDLPAVGSVAPGAHLPVRLHEGTRPLQRHYSIVGPGPQGGWRIAVKRLDAGQGGSRAMWTLAAGDAIEVGPVTQRFGIDWMTGHWLLVAGGIGVTPMVSIARALAGRGDAVRMVYAARGEAALAYRDELQDALGERLTCLSDRRVDFAAEIARLPAGGQLMVCGPAGMLDAARAAWQAAGRPAHDLRFETFASGGRSAAQPFRLRLPRHGIEVEVPADRTVLEVMEAAGVAALSDCRRGECGLCALPVLGVDGQIDHRDVFLGEHERREGRRICVCVSRATGTLTLDTAWRPEPATAV